MDNERAWFGLCGDQFGPKPFCLQTGCYPSTPLEATSHTSHKPIHGNKYVQSCSSEWLLICQIGPFYRQRNCLVSRSGYWPTLLTSREKNWASVKTTHPLWETQIYDPTIFPLLMLQKKLGCLRSICDCILIPKYFSFLVTKAVNSVILSFLFLTTVSTNCYLGHAGPH